MVLAPAATGRDHAGVTDYETPRGVRIPATAVRFSFARSGGPGGQHVNTADTKARVAIDLEECGFDEAVLERLTKRFGPVVQTSSEEHRSQGRNRETALARALTLIDRALDVPKPRRPSRPTAAAKERRLDAKAHQSKRKADRRRPSVGDD